MRWLDRALLRLRSLVRSGRVDFELDAELRFHLDQQMQLGLARGLTPAEARAAAIAEFGGLDQIKEQCRDERRVAFFDHLARDIRYAVRSLARDPGFSLVAIATVALGIGVNAAMFTIVHSVLLKPLPYLDPDRLAIVYSVSDTGPFRFTNGTFSDAAYFETQRNRTFDRLAAFDSSLPVLTGAGEPMRVPRARFTANLLPMLGVEPLIGRAFADGEDAPGRGDVAVISERLWRGRFGGDPTIVGRSIRVDGQPHTVVGVMPASFTFPASIEMAASSLVWTPSVWTPLVLDPTYDRNASHRLVGRLARTATPATAAADLLDVTTHPTGVYAKNRGGRVRVVPLKDAMVGSTTRLLGIFSGAVALVLLVACANVASLLVARGAGRSKELALRAALGASRLRIMQQLLTESGVLAAAGGAAGVLVAYGAIALVLPWVPPNKLPRVDEVALDRNVIVFAAFLCLLATIVIGTAPSWLSASGEVAAPLQDGGGRATARGATRLRSALLVAETAIVLVLLAGAGHLLRSFWLLQHVDPGFRSSGLVTVQIELPEKAYPTVERRKAFVEETLARVRAIPGTSDASAINLLPFGDMFWGGDFEVEGRPDLGKPLIVSKPAVTPDYFRALGIPLLRGRSFDEGDRAASAGVAIVSDAVARACWPGADPIGKRVRMDSSRANGWLTVVGVVGDIKHHDLSGGVHPTIYVPHAQEWRSFFLSTVAFLVRAGGPIAPVARGLRQAVREMDANLPVTNVTTLDTLLARSVAEPRFRTNLLFVFAALALALACVGAAGLVAYDVSRRTREIGIRVALGARPGEVVGLVMRRTVRLIAVGVALGVPAAAALTRLLKTFLYQVTPGDPGTLAAVSVLMMAAGVVAAFLPARHATRIEPIVALRCE